MLVLRLREPTTGEHLGCLGCVDTGADQCVFPLSFAVALGLDPLRLKQTVTAGVGSTANITYFSNILVDIPISTGVTLSFEVYAGFTDGLEAIGYGLLGQTGFFEKFKLTFDHRNKIFTIHA